MSPLFSDAIHREITFQVRLVVPIVTELAPALSLPLSLSLSPRSGPPDARSRRGGSKIKRPRAPADVYAPPRRFRGLAEAKCGFCELRSRFDRRIDLHRGSLRPRVVTIVCRQNNAKCSSG